MHQTIDIYDLEWYILEQYTTFLVLYDIAKLPWVL